MGVLFSVSMVSWGSPRSTKMLKMKGTKYCVLSGHLAQILFYFPNFKYVLNSSYVPSSLFFPFIPFSNAEGHRWSQVLELTAEFMDTVMSCAFYGLFFRCIALSKGGKCCLPCFTGGNHGTRTVEWLSWEENQGPRQVYYISSDFGEHIHVLIVREKLYHFPWSEEISLSPSLPPKAQIRNVPPGLFVETTLEKNKLIKRGMNEHVKGAVEY